MTPFGTYLRVLRTKKNVTLTELAQYLGVEPSYLSSLERGRKRKPPKSIVHGAIEFFHLDDDSANQLRHAAEISDSRFKIPANSPEDDYVLLHSIMGSLPVLSDKKRKKILLIVES